MDGMDWPSFPTRFLEDSAEDWGRLPTEEGDGEGEKALLAQLEEAFASDRGGDQDHAKALGTIQAFLSTRRVRHIEDLLVLSASLGDSGGGEGGTGADAAAAAIPPHRVEGGPLSSAADLRRELAFALNNTPKPSPATGGARNRGGGGVLLSDDGPAAVALRAAAGVSREAFFAEWAERFGTLLVPLEGGGEAGDGGDGGRARKDDREIQAARDVERDMLMVNGVLVKGSEGYPVVVGKVKRELARLAEPVAGADTAVVGASMASAGPPSGGARGGGGGGGGGAVQVRQSMPQGERTGLPLRPPRQLQNFSKLVLKAANRTESGGLSFDAIHRIMELCPGVSDGSVLVVPDSSKAEPLGINIAAESFNQSGDTPFGPLERLGVPELQDGLHAFGICANVEAATVYSLYTADMERVYLRLRATFRNSLRLPISPFSSSTCQAFSDVGYRGDRGEVEIEVLEGAHRSQH